MIIIIITLFVKKLQCYYNTQEKSVFKFQIKNNKRYLVHPLAYLSEMGKQLVYP